jgi:hypothetical protein
MSAFTTTLSVTFQKRDTEVFERLARETPKTMRSAVGRAFSILRRNIIKVMQGGDATYIPALRTWHPLTARITRVRKFGGVLADPSKIQLYKQDNVFKVGWLSRMEGAARAWQESDTYALQNPQRRMMHIILSRVGEKNHSLIPMVYQRPTRDVITTLANNTADKMVGWIQGAYEKEVQRQLKKGWTVA